MTQKNPCDLKRKFHNGGFKTLQNQFSAIFKVPLLSPGQFSEHVMAAPKEFLEIWKPAPEIPKPTFRNTLNKPEYMAKIRKFWAFLPLRLKFYQNLPLPSKRTYLRTFPASLTVRAVEDDKTEFCKTSILDKYVCEPIWKKKSSSRKTKWKKLKIYVLHSRPFTSSTKKNPL